MLCPSVRSALITLPAEMFQTSLPFFWSTLPVMPGRQTITSRISLRGGIGSSSRALARP